MEAISEGEFLHRGPVDPGLLVAMAHVTNQPVRIIEQILQQQSLLPQQVKSIVKGKRCLHQFTFMLFLVCLLHFLVFVGVQQQLHWSCKKIMTL